MTQWNLPHLNGQQQCSSLLSLSRQRKNCMRQVKEAQKTLFKTTAVGVTTVEIRERDWTQLHWNKRQRVFEHWCQLTEKTWRMLEEVVNVSGISVFADWHLSESGSYSSHRDWEIRGLSSYMIAFQRDGVSGPEVLCYKTGKGLTRKQDGRSGDSDTGLWLRVRDK